MKKTMIGTIFAAAALVSASSLNAAPAVMTRTVSPSLSVIRSFDMPIPEPGNPNVPMLAFDMPIPEPGRKTVPMVFDMPIPEPGRKTVPMDMPIPEPGRKTVPMLRES